MHRPHPQKILRFFYKCYLGAGPTKHFEKNHLSKYREENFENQGYNWAHADQMEMGFSLNNMPKRAENMPGCHQPIPGFTGSRLQFLSVRALLKKN